MNHQQGTILYWTLDRLVKAVRREAKRIGHTPTAQELARAAAAGRDVPYARSVYDRGLTLKQLYAIAELPPPPPFRKTHCKQGHPLTPDNLYVWPSSGRRCRVCHRQANRDAIKARRAARAVVGRIDTAKAAAITDAKRRYWQGAA